MQLFETLNLLNLISRKIWVAKNSKYSTLWISNFHTVSYQCWCTLNLKHNSSLSRFTVSKNGNTAAKQKKTWLKLRIFLCWRIFFVKMSPWRKKILRMTREIKTQTCSSSVYLKNVSSPSHDDFDYENSSTEISGTE